MKVEVRGQNEVIIEGYVNAAERDSKPLLRPMVSSTKFVERVDAGAFKKFLAKGKKVLLKFNHQKVLGDTESGEVELYEDEIGLHAKARIFDNEIAEKARKKLLKGWSFGFISLSERWEVISENLRRRHLEELELVEVSLLDFMPAYTAMSMELRGEEDKTLETRVLIEDDVDYTDIPDNHLVENNLKKLQAEVLGLI